MINKNKKMSADCFFFMQIIILVKKEKYISLEDMNNFNNSVFTQVFNYMQKHENQGNEEADIYDGIMHKNFQIIQTFLEKINSLYLKTDQFENTLNSLNQKFEKLESTTQNIHYEFRTTHLMIDKRINNIIHDYSNISEQIRMIKNQMPIESYLSTEQFMTKSAHLRARNKINKKILQKKEMNTQKQIVQYNIVVHEQKKSQTSSHSQYQKQLKIEGKYGLKQLNLRQLGFNIPKISRTSKNLANQQIDSHFIQNLSDSQSQEHFERLPTGLKDMNKKRDRKSKINDKSMMEIQNKIQSMNTIIEQKFQKMYKENAILKEQLNIKKENASQQLSNFQSAISDKIIFIKDGLEEEINHIKNDLDLVKINMSQNFNLMQQKLKQKIEQNYFENTLNNLSSAISDELEENQKKYCKRSQTQKAILFLQNKINKYIQNEKEETRKNMNSVDNQCLKINKAQSYHRYQRLSQDLFNFSKEKTENQKQQFNHKSLDQTICEQNNIQRDCSNSSMPKRNRLSKDQLSSKSNIGQRLQNKKEFFRNRISKSKIQDERFNRQNQFNYQKFIKVWKQKANNVLGKPCEKKKRKVTFKN